MNNNKINNSNIKLSEIEPNFNHSFSRELSNKNYNENIMNTTRNNNNFINSNLYQKSTFSSTANFLKKNKNNINNISQNNILIGHLITDIIIINQLKNLLKNHFLFNSMNEDFISYIISNFYSYDFPQNTTIYEEGDFGNFFFVLSKGVLESFNSKKIPTKIKAWKSFGESSLLNNSKREDTITSIQSVTLLVLDGYIYRECL